MITVDGSLAKFEGTAKELSFEFTHCVLGFKYNIMKEFGLSDEESNEVIAKCCEIAVMTNEDRKKFLDSMSGGDGVD